MKKYYHMASLDRVRSISNVGLIPSSEANNKLTSNAKNKIEFSEGMTGAVAQYANYQKHYDLIKSGVVGGIKPEIVEQVNSTNTMQEYLGEEVCIAFDGEDIKNEKNFMDGQTEDEIDSAKLSVCLLKNNETGKVTYLGSDIIHYMMSKVPVETISYSGTDVVEEDKIEKKTETIRDDVSKYVKDHEKEINTYRYGDYTLENIPVKKFCMQYLFQKGDNITGQNLGKATMDLLEDIEAVRAMEAQLDRAVRELTRGIDDVEQDHTLIPKEREERKTNQ